MSSWTLGGLGAWVDCDGFPGLGLVAWDGVCAFKGHDLQHLRLAPSFFSSKTSFLACRWALSRDCFRHSLSSRRSFWVLVR